MSKMKANANIKEVFCSHDMGFIGDPLDCGDEVHSSTAMVLNSQTLTSPLTGDSEIMILYCTNNCRAESYKMDHKQ